MLTIEYLADRYRIRSSDGLFFHRDGRFVAQESKETEFTIELHKGYLTFKDSDQCYLTAVGPLGIMTSRNQMPSKDEHFLLEESKLQISLIAHNGKYVSIKQGTDILANQHEQDNTTIFQIEYDDSLQSYHFRTCNNTYWKVDHQSVQAIAEQR
jgi:fascin 1